MRHAFHRQVQAGLAALVLAMSAPSAPGGNAPVTWTFDESTSGEDIAWMSPTAVDPDAPRYQGQYQLTLVEITVVWLGIPFGPLDVTDQVPPEQQMGAACALGPAPSTIFDQSIVAPEPPEPPAISADLLIGLDELGFGFLLATNVQLGTLVVDLGGIFGEQEVDLTSIRMAGQITIDTVLCPPDLNGDGGVDAADLALLLGAWDTCGGCPADINCDGAVDAADLALLLGNWGPCGNDTRP